MPNGTLAVTFQFDAGFEDSLDIPADEFLITDRGSTQASVAERRYRAPACTTAAFLQTGYSPSRLP